MTRAHDRRDRGANPTACDPRVAELRRSVAELEEAIRARDDFVSIAAHELRNPMTPILGQVERLLMIAQRRDSECPPQITAGLEMLERAVLTYISRATVLLDVNRIVSGMLRLAPAPLDLSALVTAVVERYRTPAAKLGCTLGTQIEPAVMGVWDGLAIEQIVDNLLSNAVKYGRSAPILVSLDWSENSARLVVQDRGPGISVQDRKRIFARFERVVATRDRGGFGIGLWVVRQLVEAMGATINIDSAPGQGTTFTILLPQSGGPEH